MDIIFLFLKMMQQTCRSLRHFRHIRIVQNCSNSQFYQWRHRNKVHGFLWHGCCAGRRANRQLMPVPLTRWEVPAMPKHRFALCPKFINSATDHIVSYGGQTETSFVETKCNHMKRSIATSSLESGNEISTNRSGLAHNTDSQNASTKSTERRTFFDWIKLTFPTLPIGILAGTAGTATGVGGAILATPLILRFVKYDSPHQVTGTAAICLSLGVLCGATMLFANNSVDVPTAAILGISAACTIVVGARLNRFLSRKTLEKVLAMALLLFAPVVSLKTYFEHRREAKIQEATKLGLPFKHLPKEKSLFDHDRIHRVPALICLGAVVGIVNGCVGFGGGLIMTTTLCMTEHSFHELPYPIIVGTTLSSLVLPSFIGAIMHYRMGNFIRAAGCSGLMRYMPILSLVFGTSLGAIIGGKLALILPEDWSRGIFVFLRIFLRNEPTESDISTENCCSVVID